MPVNRERGRSLLLNRGDHPDAERLAAYVDRILSADANAEVEEHLASCAECRSVVADVAIFVDEMTATSTRGRNRIRATRWTSPWIAAPAVAAAIALAVVATLRWTRPHPADVDALVAVYAHERVRLVEGRLTGGFSYAPPPLATRGEGRDLSPDVRIAAAQIEKRATRDNTAASDATLGVALLATRDFDRAVGRLERATDREPTNAAFLSDLAAAYLARAAWAGRADDLPRALAAADRAIAANPRQLEAQFNRALALQALHLDDQAAAAWRAYAAKDAASPWAAEATKRADTLRDRSRSSKGGVFDRQIMRERLEDELLVRWGTAILDRDAETASEALRECDVAALALASAGGDGMAIDELRLIHRFIATGDRPDVEEIARGHMLYGRARRDFVSDRLHEASERMTEAAAAFRRVGSAYEWWGPIYRAIAGRIAGAAESALEDLRTGDKRPVPPSYHNLQGRLAWTRAAALETLGRFDVARTALHDAVDHFTAAGEWENTATIEMGLAEANWYLGDGPSTWQHEMNAIGRLEVMRTASRRNAVLLEAATFALGARLPESALEFQDALIALVERDGTDVSRADAYRLRARILARLGRSADAEAAASRSADALSRIEDQGLRTRAAAELDLVRAELLVNRDAREAAAAASTALEYAQRNGYAVRAAELLSLRAAAREREHEDGEAERDLRDALGRIDALRLGLARIPDQIQALDQHRQVLRRLIRLEAISRNQTEAALQIAEAGRGRSTVATNQGTAAFVVDPLLARARLNDDTALVYYAVLDDRVLTWILTKGAVSTRVASVAESALASDVRRLSRVAEEGAGYQQFAIAARELSDRFVIPALEAASGKSRLVFVPDGALAALPFPALPDRRGRPIVESATVLVAPSVTAFLDDSERLARFTPHRVLAIGDGHATDGSELPRLVQADVEAASVGRLYPDADVLAGSDASRARVLADDHDVIHFAGHTVSNVEFPMLSRVLLAPEGVDDSGALFVSDILQRRFTRTGVMVLASCESASGKSFSGDSALSIARAFVDAGVPSVVASLWTIEDQPDGIMPAFHRALLRHGDPAAALRESQIAWFRGHPDSPVRSWAGFEALGGDHQTLSED